MSLSQNPLAAQESFTYAVGGAVSRMQRDLIDLVTLRRVEKVVTQLGKQQRRISSYEKFFSDFAEQVSGFSPTVLAEYQDDYVEASALTESLYRDYISVLEARRQAAIDDPALPQPHEGSVMEEFDRLIVQIKNFLDTLVSLRWSIVERVADAESYENEPVFDNVEDLVSYLNR